jgi:hypothetical protein
MLSTLELSIFFFFVLSRNFSWDVRAKVNMLSKSVPNFVIISSFPQLSSLFLPFSLSFLSFLYFSLFFSLSLYLFFFSLSLSFYLSNSLSLFLFFSIFCSFQLSFLDSFSLSVYPSSISVYSKLVCLYVPMLECRLP